MFTCVCEKHQNVKFVIDEMHDNTEKYFLMNVIVCDVYTYACIMNPCENFTGTRPLRDLLMSEVGDGQLKLKR